MGRFADRFELDEDELQDLASSIFSTGLRQPIEVREIEGGYELVSGHRRLSAVQRIGWPEIEAFIIDPDEKEATRITFSENFMRADLSPVELAVKIQKVYESGEMEVGEIARTLHRSEDWVKRQISVTLWPMDVLQGIHSGAFSVSAGANLAQITEDSYRQFLVRQAAENGATARTTASWLQCWRSAQPVEAAAAAGPVDGPAAPEPIIPRGPCLRCGQVFRSDAMSFVPLCVQCVGVVRSRE